MNPRAGLLGRAYKVRILTSKVAFRSAKVAVFRLFRGAKGDYCKGWGLVNDVQAIQRSKSPIHECPFKSNAAVTVVAHTADIATITTANHGARSGHFANCQSPARCARVASPTAEYRKRVKSRCVRSSTGHTSSAAVSSGATPQVTIGSSPRCSENSKLPRSLGVECNLQPDVGRSWQPSAHHARHFVMTSLPTSSRGECRLCPVLSVKCCIARLRMLGSRRSPDTERGLPPNNRHSFASLRCLPRALFHGCLLWAHPPR